MQRNFAQAVAALYLVLIGQRAAMQLQIQFARVYAGALYIAFKHVHEVAYRHVLAARYARQIVQAARRLDHLELRTAAAVALAI